MKARRAELSFHERKRPSPHLSYPTFQPSSAIPSPSSSSSNLVRDFDTFKIFIIIITIMNVIIISIIIIGKEEKAGFKVDVCPMAGAQSKLCIFTQLPLSSMHPCPPLHRAHFPSFRALSCTFVHLCAHLCTVYNAHSAVLGAFPLNAN